jgi:hypothetical protein
VWDQLPDPETFLDHLQLKAGLAPTRWPEGMQAWRFTTDTFGRGIGQQPYPSRAA